MDVLAPPSPRPDAVLEPGERRVFALAARQEGAEAVQCGELEVARLGADAGVAIGLYEVDSPSISVELEVEQDAGHRSKPFSAQFLRLYKSPTRLFHPSLTASLSEIQAGLDGCLPLS